MLVAILGRLLAIGLLVWALDIHEYSYFTLLRIVVCLVGAYCAAVDSDCNREGWTLTLGGIAVLFNPIIPFRMSRDVWQLVDIIVAGIFFVSLFGVRKRKTEKKV